MGIDSFFGIGGPEFLFILILAGIFLGPGRIAKLARWLGQTTAKLQNISRGFVGQLKSELDMAEGSDDIKEMFKEMQDLKNEVSNLQNQLTTTLNDATAETTQSMNELAELTNSIRPPTFDTDTPTIGQNGANGTADKLDLPDPPSKNGSNGTAPAAAPPPLPNPLSIEDDPE